MQPSDRDSEPQGVPGPAPQSPPQPVPDILRKPPVTPPPTDEPEVGDFRPGSPFSRLSLSGYLVGRAMTESLGNALYALALVLLGIAALGYWVGDSAVLGVLFVVLALAVLIMRGLLLAVLRRLTGFGRFGRVEDRIRTLAGDTKGDVLRELRRVGLPGRAFSVWLVPLRLVRPGRRVETLQRLRAFEVSNAVPPARVDELHLLLRQAASGGLR